MVTTLQGCKLARVKGLLFGCCQALLAIEDSLPPSAAPAPPSPDWVQVWETALNVVGSNQCVEEGHGLMRALLLASRGRIDRAAAAERLYENAANRVMKCSPAAVRTLLAALGQRPPPRGQQGQPALREALLGWLHDDAEDDDELRRAEWNRVADDDPESVAEVYAALTVKKARRASGRADSSRSVYDRIESDLLETSLVALPAGAILSGRTAAATAAGDGFAAAAIPEMEAAVHDSLIRQAGAQLQRLSRRDSMRPERDVAEALRHLHLLLRYLTARKRLNPAFMEGESRKRSVPEKARASRITCPN